MNTIYIGVVGPKGKTGFIKSYMDERKFEKERDLIWYMIVN